MVVDEYGYVPIVASGRAETIVSRETTRRFEPRGYGGIGLFIRDDVALAADGLDAATSQ